MSVTSVMPTSRSSATSLPPCGVKYTRDLGSVNSPAAELCEEAFDRSVKQMPASLLALRCQDPNEAELVLYSLSDDESEVRVEEHEFSDSEDEGVPTYLPGLEEFMQNFVSLALTPSAPKLEARPDPDLRLSDVPPLNAPRSASRRASIRSWTEAVLLYRAAAEKTHDLKSVVPPQLNLTEEKTFRSETNEQPNRPVMHTLVKRTSITRASIKRSRPADE